MEKKQQDDFVLNEELSTVREQPKGKDADYYTRILVAFTFAASALLILFNVFSGFFPVRSAVEFHSTASSHGSFSSSPGVSSTVLGQQQSNTVYWTSGGSVYHLRRDCSTLSRSTNVLSGSVESAHKAGKANPCKICGGS